MHPETDAKGLSREALAGLVLLAAAVLALIVANSPWHGLYNQLLESHVALGVAPFVLEKSLLHWINDGLMAIFFLVVGLEIKREMVKGALSSTKTAALPVIGAIGGMLLPAAIYAAINWGDPVAIRGWAIPAATDIAFAVGVLALLGPRIPLALKVFLLALAIIDDLGAIIIIALFYTTDLSVTALALAALGIAALALLNFAGSVRIWPYLLIGLFVWICVLKSGVHATLAGVATALAIPLTTNRDGESNPLERLEHTLSPWVSFLILPVFAFANAGVSLAGITMDQALSSVPLGIALGLVLGKSIGIFVFSQAAIAMRIGEMPAGATNIQLFGTSVLGGIGFTMSLFIGMLAFSDPTLGAEVRLGVLSGSLVSALLGYIILSQSKSR